MKKTEDYEYMVCIDNMEEKPCQYDVIKIINYSMLCEIMPLLNEQMRNKKFTDFVDCFSQNNIFFAVFRHTDNIMLFEYLKKFSYNTNERLEIIKNLAEKIVMMNIPVSIQTDILLSESIAVSESMRVDFKYNLTHMNEYASLDFEKFQKSMCDIVKKVLEKEYKNNISEKLVKYCENLEKGVFSEYIEIYSEYMRVYDEVTNNINQETLKKQSRWLKIWEKIMSLFKMIKPFAVCLVILLALVYLIYTLVGYDKEDTSQYNNYKTIGSLVIKEYNSNDDITENSGEEQKGE